MFMKLSDELQEVPRNSVFLANEMWPTDYGIESAIQEAKSSITKLGTDYSGMLRTSTNNRTFELS